MLFEVLPNDRNLMASTCSKSTIDILDQYPWVFFISVFFGNLKEVFEH